MARFFSLFLSSTKIKFNLSNMLLNLVNLCFNLNIKVITTDLVCQIYKRLYSGIRSITRENYQTMRTISKYLFEITKRQVFGT